MIKEVYHIFLEVVKQQRVSYRSMKSFVDNKQEIIEMVGKKHRYLE